MKPILLLFAVPLLLGPVRSFAADKTAPVSLDAAQFKRLFGHKEQKKKENKTDSASAIRPMIAVASAMGMRNHPILGGRRFHAGVDLAVPAGTPIQATADGQVARAGSAGGYGLLVILRHPSGYETRYAHMARIAVTPGQHLRRGELIGYVGSTGLSTGPHLHYEVRRAGEPLSPIAFLRK